MTTRKIGANLLKFLGVLLLFFVLLFIFVAFRIYEPLPSPKSTEERLSAFPVSKLPVSANVTIHWDRFQIPFIEAETDDDLFLALGMVHAHLRLAQMEILRRVSSGTVSEVVGPIGTRIDHSLRILDLGRAAYEIERRMPEETRRFLSRFVDGINLYIDELEELPHEFKLFKIEPERWEIRDVIVLSRLVSTDVNWLIWLNLLIHRKDESVWPELWQSLMRSGEKSYPSFDLPPVSPIVFDSYGAEHLAYLSKSGSNSFVVSGEKSHTGAPFIASDPHVGFSVPNIWLLGAYKSPGFNVSGVMFPGLPLTLLGRNRQIAWGATNMWSLSSSLYDIDHIEPELKTERLETIQVRWWRDIQLPIRETPFGPVITGMPHLRDYRGQDMSLKWRGHFPSDEFSSIFAVNRATNFSEFRDAFDSYAVSGQNYLYADTQGNIGQVLAADLPVKGRFEFDDFVLDATEEKNHWKDTCNVHCLPWAYNPSAGFLVSTNNLPVRRDPPVGYFFSVNDRFERIRDLLMENGRISFDDVRLIQTDVAGISAAKNAEVFYRSAIRIFDSRNTEAIRSFLDALGSWDGKYSVSSAGALAYELLNYYFTRNYYRRLYNEEVADLFIRSPLMQGVLADDVSDPHEVEVFESSLEEAVRAAAVRFEEFDNWGSFHRLQLGHHFSNIPWIGERYVFADFPVPGATETVWKTAASRSSDPHSARYGAVARHISDLSDYDANYFVLLGGQDGWINSENFLDQVERWREGEYVQIPLQAETARARAEFTMTLSP